MSKYNFVITEDNSVGLYSNEARDILHSKTGALKEAFDKFIYPSFLPELYKTNVSLNILDICYGIGYNTKAALSIMPDNYSLNIDCLDYDNDLINISPFINDGLNDIDIKLLLLASIKDKNLSFLDENKLMMNKKYFSSNLVTFIQFLVFKGYNSNLVGLDLTFLHNIYYNYISNSINNVVKPNKYNKCTIKYKIGDARKTLQTLNKEYNVVFLDGFSPQKDPTLWTINFLSLIKEKMNDESILVSYSKSTPFRKALIDLGFYVGKTYIDNIDMGTVATLNKDKVINPLTNFDIELLNTRSGIPFKDNDFNLSGSDILKNREIELKSSNLISHTQFLKKYKK